MTWKKRIKNLPTWLKILIVINMVIAVLLIGTYAFISSKLNMINRPEVFATVQPEDEYFEVEEPDYISDTEMVEDSIKPEWEVRYQDIVWPEDGDLLHDKKIINILLIGQDRRKGQTRARSDGMMIATINKKEGTISLTSLMRDMYVQIPGYSDNRINAAYAFGGMELLDESIEKNFQVHIDGNIEVDFTGFQEVINRIGGVEMELNAEEAAYLRGLGYGYLTEGIVAMDGSLALTYSRMRYVGNSDYERTERQRRVMTVVFDKINKMGLGEILGMIDIMFPLVTTDLSNGQMISLATTVVLMGVKEVGTHCIPVEGGYTPSKVRGMDVLVPDLESNRAALKRIILGE